MTEAASQTGEHGIPVVANDIPRGVTTALAVQIIGVFAGLPISFLNRPLAAVVAGISSAALFTTIALASRAKQQPQSEAPAQAPTTEDLLNTLPPFNKSGQ